MHGHGPTLAALLAVAVTIGPAGSGRALASDAPGAIARARALLSKDDAKGAVAVLRDALPTAGADLGPMIVVLRRAYALAAEQAAKSGRPEEAEDYREDLQILNRRMRGKPEPAASKVASPAAPSPIPPEAVARPTAEPIAVATTPRPEPEPGAPDPLSVAHPEPDPEPSPEPARPDPESSPEPARPVAVPEPAPRDEAVARAVAVAAPKRQAAPAPDPTAMLREADRAYLAGLYLDANRRYAALDRIGGLPEGRKIHWAYCRSVDVVRRLKAKPASAAEWAAIDREILAIKALSPRYWYAEYLRNRAAESSRAASRSPKDRVVRGAMPESDTESEPSRSAEASKGRDPTRPAPTADAPPAGRLGRPGAFAMAVPSTDTPPVLTSHGESGRWRLTETENFAIYHDDPALADRIATAAEATRTAATRRWAGSPPPRAWSPKCEIYLYPTAAIFAQVTGQPAESPGFSTMESDGAAISGRRIKLRADAPRLVEAVLPHEVTHVILADLFPARQIARWADEGLAVLSEPDPDQDRRVADLDAALDGGRIFTVEHLMVRDYPEGKYWPLYYAQSVSLTRFLVEQGKPAQFIDFLQGSQARGVEPELKRVYDIDGFADLQRRWLDYAKSASTARVASARGDGAKVR